ncbi:MAG TPA: hypothetical protein VKV80_11705 [Streptosporangiaceae bacterium]|nr:hypothetical protein [Streptosporangiaceae bacterium]
MVMNAQRTREPAQEQLDCLGKLGDELIRRGLCARLVLPPGRVPSLHVVNPQAAMLDEDVYADRGSDGALWFWWSWAERIAVAGDVTTAAAVIARVLTGRGPGAP